MNVTHGADAQRPVSALPMTPGRSTQTPEPGGAGTAESPESHPLQVITHSGRAGVSRRSVARFPSRASGTPDVLQAGGEPSHDHHRPGAAHSRRLSPPRTGSHPGQRAGWRRRRRRRLHDPPATSGPPLHVHAVSDETFFVFSGVLLVHADGQVATIPEGGLVTVSRGMPHTFATTPGSPARFLVLHAPGGSGESRIAAAHAVQEHGGPLRATTSSSLRTRAAGPRSTIVPGAGT